MTKNDPILVLASGNAGKIREFQAMFSHLNVHVESQKTFGVKPCPEPFHTFIENCLAKARHAAKETGRLTILDCAWMHWAERRVSIPPALRAKMLQTRTTTAC